MQLCYGLAAGGDHPSSVGNRQQVIGITFVGVCAFPFFEGQQSLFPWSAGVSPQFLRHVSILATIPALVAAISANLGKLAFCQSWQQVLTISGAFNGLTAPAIWKWFLQERQTRRRDFKGKEVVIEQHLYNRNSHLLVT
jgi:hypothetical protein